MAAPVLLWLRRDLRLADHPALSAAVKRGGPVIPVYIRDAAVDDLGAAAKWRLGEGLAVYARALEDKGARLILRAGPALEVLQALIAETGAEAVYWTRAYDPFAVERDTHVKAALKDAGIEARSFGGHLLFEPWTAETKAGGFFKVYTPFWKAVRDRDVESPLPAPGRIPAPDVWPDSEALGDWQLGAAMNRGAAVLAAHSSPGEAAAADRLGAFIEERIADYRDDRDRPAIAGTSGLSEYLTLGEISPHSCWHAGIRARQEGVKGAETWVKELVWREFAYHLMHHSPQILTGNWREEWDAFPWREEEDSKVLAWKQGRTGIPFVDAAMREMYVTGRMHNRGRMIVGSYLTKHLMTHWRIGLEWFADCLTDWDPASNAMGWQWVAGSGPDAAPYFRIFNPVTQLEKFDPMGAYPRRWVAEGQGSPPDTALAFFEAVPRRWKLRPDAAYPPKPIVDLKAGREAALEAYKGRPGG